MLDAFANATLTGNVYLDAGMLAAAGFIGPIFPMVPASTEMLCTAFGLKGFSPMLAGLSCAFGQCSLYVLLFLFGERFFATRCKFLRRRVDTLAFKHRRLFERSSCAITAGAGAIGLPPTVPLFILAPSLNMHLVPMLGIVFPFRFVRFFVVCALAGGFALLPPGLSQLHVLNTPRMILRDRAFYRPQDSNRTTLAGILPPAGAQTMEQHKAVLSETINA